MKEGRRLPRAFFVRTDVAQIARDLLGMVLVTKYGGERTAGRIVETEAYRGPDDKACHAYGNRRTARTEVMFGPGGHAYVYLCYGIHHLFNVVTAPEGQAHAVLIRAIEPLENVGRMLQRRQRPAPTPQLTSGPGVMSKALGITIADTGLDLLDPHGPIWIEDPRQQQTRIGSGPRIGVDYAEECALWPWRFWIEGNEWVSGKRKRGQRLKG